MNHEIFRKVYQAKETPEIDLSAIRVSHQLPQYRLWKPDLLSMRQHSFQINWRQKFSYVKNSLNSVPSFVLKGRVLKKTPQNHDYNNTSMSKPATVSTVAPALKKEPDPFTFQERSTMGLIGQCSSTNSGRFAQTTSLDDFREKLHAEGISKWATELTANSR